MLFGFPLVVTANRCFGSPRPRVGMMGGVVGYKDMGRVAVLGLEHGAEARKRKKKKRKKPQWL